jgi:uncharacterized surface protein with fasciclin (FAS1) repeats
MGLRKEDRVIIYVGHALRSEGPFTVFAPDDEALSKVPKETLNALLNDIEKLKEVLLYHVIQGKVYSSQAMELTKDGKTIEAKTLQGKSIRVTQKGMFSKSLYINDAKVIRADIEASNGVIHVIDKVLIP